MCKHLVLAVGPGHNLPPQRCNSSAFHFSKLINGRAELFRELRHKTVCAIRVDMEAYA